MNAIEIKNLTKKYKDVTAVNSLSINVREGELFALLGVNGAGKTTTIKMLSCLVSPTEGDAVLLGHSVLSEPQRVKELIGVCPQQTAVAEGLSVEENLDFMCGAFGLSRAERLAKREQLIKAFSLESVKTKKAAKLSGGFARRLSIAMTLVGNPKIVFLDEPTLGLDVIARSELWDTIRELKKVSTIVLTTHYMEEAEALSDRVGIMKDGVLLSVGTPQEIKAIAGEDKFENAFIKIVRGNSK